MQLDNYIITLKSGQLFEKLEAQPSMHFFAYDPVVLEKIDNGKFFVAHQFNVSVINQNNNKVADLVIAVQANIIANETEINGENIFNQLKDIYFYQINTLLTDLQLPVLSYQNYNIVCRNIQFIKKE